MTYFVDLSNYSYFESGKSWLRAASILWLGLGHKVPDAAPFRHAGTRNVGWLASGHDFPTETPTDETLDLVWEHCKISVAQSRGFHRCEFCSINCGDAERYGERLLLGSAEIRVFSSAGFIYAAPTLIYHYIFAHRYRPPDEFLQALNDGPRPPSREYFERLKECGLAWNKTSVPR